MCDVINVKGRKYIRLGHVTLAAVEPACEFLLDDEDFVEKVKIAYVVQVEYNRGWGFTVRYKGYRIRFELENSTGFKLPRIYRGYVEEAPETVQKTLLEVTG